MLHLLFAPDPKRRGTLKRFAALCASLAWVAAGSLLLAAEETTPWDTRSDTWVATDALGRALPLHEQVGPPRADRTVGLFYFLWHGEHINGGPYDITRILQQDPGAMTNKLSPLWGPMHAPHHWGESIFGYYLTDDDGVLRKHAQMLADAGVDVILFDVSNQVTYKPYYMALLRVFDEVRRQGGRPPQIGFLCPFWDPAKVAAEVYRDLYAPNLYPDLWFRWEGKPLILADPAKLGQTEEGARIKEFFTFRKPQPDYFQGQTGPNMWSWLEVYPQHVFTNLAGQKEQMSVGVAQNAVTNRLGSMSELEARGRSFHGGATDPRPDAVRYGLNAAEQWERARREDPRFVFITGWNEWIAGRFDEFNRIKLPVMFVDQFDQEHSRDIEPMHGGHGDDYYYQMVANIRRYKGARELPEVKTRRIAIDGRFTDWQEVQPEFRDTVGDPARRRHRGWDPQTTYTNVTGRNDIVATKLAWDSRHLYAYVRTREALTPSSDPNWMLLFLDIDANATNGWLGYDVVVRGADERGRKRALERHVGSGYQWEKAGAVGYRVSGDEMEIAIPRAALGLRRLPAWVDFKWADNLQQTGDWSDFTLNGDAAPNDRFNYRAKLRQER